MMKTNELSPVQPVSPAAGYIGGKRKLAKLLCERIAAVPHRTYCEAFVGMGVNGGVKTGHGAEQKSATAAPA